MKIIADISGNVSIIEETEADILQASRDHTNFINSRDPYWLHMRKKLYSSDIDPNLPVALSDYHLDNQVNALLALQQRKTEIKEQYPKTLIEYPIDTVPEVYIEPETQTDEPVEEG